MHVDLSTDLPNMTSVIDSQQQEQQSFRIHVSASHPSHGDLLVLNFLKKFIKTVGSLFMQKLTTMQMYVSDTLTPRALQFF